MKTSKNHSRQLLKITKEMTANYQQNKKVLIYHGSSNSTRILSFQKNAIINISHLNKVLAINKKQKYAVVEPNVSLDTLVDESLKHGLVPPVVMEFPGITVGGGIQGGAGESSSFKWGLFDESFSEYEVVLGNGKILSVSASKNADLFYGLPSSYGTLGIITAAKLKLIPARRFVRLTYIRTNNFKEALEVIKKKTGENMDFVDGILFSKNLGVVMVGKMTDEVGSKTFTFSRAWDDWFYLHAEKVAKKHKIWEEIIPIREYLFRYDRGAFWTGKYVFKSAMLPFNRLTRFLLNPIFKTRRLYRLLHALKTSQQSIVQDISLPEKSTEKFLSYVDKKLNIYPLWLCPLKPTDEEFMSPTYIKTNLVIDVGVWQRKNRDFPTMLKLSLDLEKKTKILGGRKVLYALNYYPKKEFWFTYDYKRYNKLREKYFSKRTLPDVYEKIIVKGKYNVTYIGGLISFLKSPARLPIS